MRCERLSSRALLGVALGGVTTLALLVAGCGGGSGEQSPSPSPSQTQSASETPAETAEATPTVEPATLTTLDELQVSDDLTAQPEVSAPYPFRVDQTMDKVIVEGSGREVPSATSSVQVQYLGINARTGEPFDASWTKGQPATFQLSQLIPGFAKGVVGKKVGSRVAVAITSTDAYDPAGQPTIGIKPGDTLIFVVDILDTELPGPSGEPVAAAEGLPQVTEAGGVPMITIPAGLAEPTETKVQPLIQGTGRPLAESDTITSHAICVAWDGTEYYNDYASAPVNDAASGSVHKALFSALTGQNTGSRVLVVLPGSVAYPNGYRTPSLAPNTSVACVVDILFTQPR